MATTRSDPGVSLAAETLRELYAHARAAYPDECCGIVLRRAGSEVVRKIRNVQDAMHARDAVRYPRTARVAYYMDGKELLEVMRETDEDGWEIAAFYHSHPDHASYFSDEDRERALFDGEPLYPETAYVIVALDAGAIREAKAFQWDPAPRAFHEFPLVVGGEG